MKKIYLFITSFIFFSFLVFILWNYFFWWQEKYLNEYIENKYIEPSISVDDKSKEKIIENSGLTDEDRKKIQVILKSAYKIKFIYYPSNFKEYILKYTNSLKTFLNSIYIRDKIEELKIEMYKEKWEVRWKMKDHVIKMYWINNMEVNEFSSVWIHEFWHFIDLYFFKKEILTDKSNYFYKISWDWVKTLKPWLKQLDFVSGYAMTNKYEDFAESFTYFVLHNSDFLKKTANSKILKQKYIFFSKYLFKDKEFLKTDFSINNKILDYYRDITKIDFSLENFLQFMKK